LAIADQSSHVTDRDRMVSEQVGGGVRAPALEVLAEASIAELLIDAL
jgi:hypothetical protein